MEDHVGDGKGDGIEPSQRKAVEEEGRWYWVGGRFLMCRAAYNKRRCCWTFCNDNLVGVENNYKLVF